MNKFEIIKGIYNSPFKQCIVTKDFYPMLLMIRYVKIFDSNKHRSFYIPDQMYNKVIFY
jgi:hypothetical protein